MDKFVFFFKSAGFQFFGVFFENNQILNESISCISFFMQEFANNKGADQPAHPHGLISAFAVQICESISRIAMSKITKFWLVSVADETGFSLAL